MRKLFLPPVSRLQIATVIFFGAAYSLLSLVNHYNFRTYAFDLGLMNHALYDYAHFRFNHATLLEPELNNYLSEHFEVFIMLLSPFSYLFGTYTLLIFQILFVLFGGYGVFRYIKEVSGNERTAFLAQVHFYFFYGVFSALNFDFHNNVIGAMLVPWLFYFFHLKKWKWAAAFFISILLTKENMPLWMGFVCAGLVVLYWKDKTHRRAGFLGFLFSVSSFLLIVQVIMPVLANNGEEYVQFRSNYSALGASLGEITSTLLTSPLEVFRLLFYNHSGNSLGNYYKTETYLFLFLSGGVFFLLRPQFILMVIPIVAQKMFHNDYLKWGIGDHYSVEFAPICSMGAFYVISSLQDEQWKKYLGYGAAALSLILSFRSFDRSYTYFDRDRHRVYQARHYKKDYDAAEGRRALDLIPPGTAVSAQSPFVPHLAFREKIYQFPAVKDAEYIVFSYEESPYPITKDSFAVQAAMLISSPEWEKIYDENSMVILKRKAI